MHNDELRIPTFEEYHATLISLDSELTQSQRRILIALSHVEDAPAPAAVVAKDLNVSADEANECIFELCRMIDGELGGDVWCGLSPMQTMTATTCGVKDRQWLWTMDRSFAEAIGRMNWS